MDGELQAALGFRHPRRVSPVYHRADCPILGQKQATLLLGWLIFLCGGDDVVTVAVSSLAQLPNLLPDELLGDACPCSEGCPGTKVLPLNPRAKKLAIAIPCERCGAERPSYQKRTKGLHKRHCLPCSQYGIVRARQTNSAAHPGFQRLLVSILKNRGIPLSTACSLAGLDQSTIYGWINGETTPFRKNLEKLAQVLEAPALVDAIASRALTVTTTCPKCGESRPWTAGVLRDEIRKTPKVTATIDWKKGTGSRPCVKCTRGKNMKIVREKLKHNRKGKNGNGYYEQFLRTFTPEESALGIANSARVNTGRERTKEERLKIAAGHIRPVLSGALTLCRLCSFMVYTFPHHLPNIHEVHQPCLQEYCRENQTSFDDHCYPPRIIDGNPALTPDDCKRLYEVAVRVLLRVPRDEGETVGNIARNHGVTQRTVRLWVNELLELLPSDERGGQWLIKKAEALRWASDSNQARQQVPPTKPEKKLRPMEIAQAFLLTEVPSATGLVPSVQLFSSAKARKITKKTLQMALKKGRYKAIQFGSAWHYRRKRPREA